MPLAGYGIDGGSRAGLAFFLLGIPTAAIGEELLYRGIIQTALERICHPAAAILLSSGLFVLSHVSAQPIFEDGPTVTSIAASGVILGAIYQRTRNIWLVVILHALLDYVLFLPKFHVLDADIASIANMTALCGALTWWWLDDARARVKPGEIGPA